MKIALITKRVSQSLGGAERVSVNLAGKLLASGHDVHILTGYIDTDMEGAKIHLIKTVKGLSPLRLLLFQHNVKNVLRREGFDLVYSLCQTYPVDIYRVGDGIHRHWMKVQHPNILLRWLKYFTSLVHFTMRVLEGKIFSKDKCRLFITNSILVKKQIIEYFHIPEEKIRVIYNGVDHTVFNTGVKGYRTEMRRKYGINDSDLVILFVSNNWERKGLATIIEAISKTKIQKIKLILVGRGNAKRFISLAGNNNINTGNITFTGRTADVEKYYGMSDIFILPSRYEPFANVCLEAMACGLPVVTTKTNGASELIKEGANGFILENWNDSDRLSELIKKLNDKRILEDMGHNAADTAISYTWDKHIKETNDVFEMLRN